MLSLMETNCNNRDDNVFRRRALRDAIMCIAWLKLFSIICYIGLYFMVLLNTDDKSEYAQILQIAVLSAIVPLVILGILLIVGAMTESSSAITVALFISVLLAIYDILLGVAGAIYFVRTGSKTIHFLIAVAFVMLALSFFPLMGNDWYVMYSYKKLVDCY